jgi:putative metallopeptidase
LIGMDLIRTVPDHEPLAAVHIYWLFMDTVPMSHGRHVLGRARRVSGWAAFLAQGPVEATSYETPVPFYAIEIAEQPWHHLRDHQKVALVDHELCHLKVDLEGDAPVLKIRGHDFEEFTAVIRRHGLWSTASQEGAMAMAEQLAASLDEITSFVNEVATPPEDVDPDTGEITDRDDGGDD